jgi:hypothetical protein
VVVALDEVEVVAAVDVGVVGIVEVEVDAEAFIVDVAGLLVDSVIVAEVVDAVDLVVEGKVVVVLNFVVDEDCVDLEVDLVSDSEASVGLAVEIVDLVVVDEVIGLVVVVD